MKLRVGVIFGGKSVEHEVSIISAIEAIHHMDTKKYDIVPIYISKERKLYTGDNLLKIENYKDLEKIKKNAKEIVLCKIDNDVSLLNAKGVFNKVVDKIDVAFPIVHGQNVEDGSLAGFLETLDIPYVGSGVLGSSLGQDKVVLKQVLQSSNIPVVDYVWFYDQEYMLNEKDYLKRIEEMGYPVIVKPASLGSSVGISFAANKKDLKKAIEEAISYDSKIVVEKAVENLVEVNCSVLGNYEHQEASVIEEVTSKNDFLTYDDKYVGESSKKSGSKGIVNTSRRIPAEIGTELTKKVEELSKATFKALNLSGVCRIDFLINKKTKKVYVNEPNTIPGSLSYYLWVAKDKPYPELLDDLITLSIKTYKNKEKKTTCFSTNILQNFNGVKGNKK